MARRCRHADLPCTGCATRSPAVTGIRREVEARDRRSDGRRRRRLSVSDRPATGRGTRRRNERSNVAPIGDTCGTVTGVRCCQRKPWPTVTQNAGEREHGEHRAGDAESRQHAVAGLPPHQARPLQAIPDRELPGRPVPAPPPPARCHGSRTAPAPGATVRRTRARRRTPRPTGTASGRAATSTLRLAAARCDLTTALPRKPRAAGAVRASRPSAQRRSRR